MVIEDYPCKLIRVSNCKTFGMANSNLDSYNSPFSLSSNAPARYSGTLSNHAYLTKKTILIVKN